MTKKKKKKKKEKVLFVPVKDINKNIGTVVESLKDYLRWFDGAEPADKEKQVQIKEAIHFAEGLEWSAGEL